MVASRKDTKSRSIHKNNNYECRVRKAKDDEDVERQLQVVKRKSYLYDRFSSEGQQVERRKRTTSSSLDNRNRPVSLTVSGIQEICMVDIKTQLSELTKKVTKLMETTEMRLKLIESKLNDIQPP